MIAVDGPRTQAALSPSAVAAWDVMCDARGVPAWARDAALVAWRLAAASPPRSHPQLIQAVLLMAQADAETGGSPDDCLDAVLMAARTIAAAEAGLVDAVTP